MSDLKVFNRKKGIIKSKLTLFSKFLERVENEGDTQSKEGLLTELRTRLDDVLGLLTEFNEIQEEIDLLVLDEEFESHDSDNIRGEFQDNYYQIVSRAKGVLKESDGSSESSRNSVSNHSSQRGSIVLNNKNSELARTGSCRPNLPAIPLPSFSGQDEQWLEFRDTFESLVHNSQLANIEKFHFLKSALRGEAQEVIKLVKVVSSENYEIVWRLLCERYDDTPQLVDKHLSGMTNFPLILRESAVELRNMLDTITKTLLALEKLGVSTQSWDCIIIHLLKDKLDRATYRLWEERRPKTRLADVAEFKEFLKNRVGALKNITNRDGGKPFNKFKVNKALVTTESGKCVFCKGNQHVIQDCAEFLKLKVFHRFQRIKKMGLCLNCLHGTDHVSRLCGRNGCSKCGLKHHTLLHYGSVVNGGAQESTVATNSVLVENDCGGELPGTSSSVQVNSLWLSDGSEVEGEVLLSTVAIRVIDSAGNMSMCRALLDTGSQPNLITAELAEKLGLSQRAVDVSLSGVGGRSASVGKRCVVGIESIHGGFHRDISCLVVSQISGLIPSQQIPVSSLRIPEHVKLADPGFGNPGRIDMLLGVDVFYDILCIGQVKLGQGLPRLQKTRFGWVVTGSMGFARKGARAVGCYINQLNADIGQQLEKFWKLEEVPFVDKTWSSEEETCERIFRNTTARASDGKFIVRIPFKGPIERLGSSRRQAVNRLLALERKLGRNSELQKLYVEFMNEYQVMGHMSECVGHSDEVSYFFPHHGVLKENSATTKLRVVFDGSAVSDSGVSLNELQCNGPKLQDDLMLILLRFRQHSIVVCGDVAKMYRMIWIDPGQRNLQKILWRSSPLSEMKEYTLNTVTYGTKAAPFLAIRCLRQLGLEHQDMYPRAARAILEDFYVDDMLTGAESAGEAIQLGQQVAAILNTGGMELRKWVSNDSSVSGALTHGRENCELVEFGDNGHKTLGLFWKTSEDSLMFSIDFLEESRCTKRSILSNVSRIFDPLGLVAPSILLAKVLLRKLWQENIQWDESLPLSLESEWIRLRADFVNLNRLRVPRRVVLGNAGHVDIHGFCDASMLAYGACIYLRSTDSVGNSRVSLLCSKVKVAPLKGLTIPRLELCGALLLASLVSRVKSALTVRVEEIYMWTDSTVVLGWLRMDHSRLNVFVAHRVDQILSMTRVNEWRHVRSEYNPADVASRGAQPSALIGIERWWRGPEWLELDPSCWPTLELENGLDELPELRRRGVVHVSTVSDGGGFPFDRFGSFNRMKRVVAYCFRFINSKRFVNRMGEPLSSDELEYSLRALVLASQKESFSLEMIEVASGRGVKNRSLRLLNLFLDESGCLRVGGRLQMASVSYTKKYPLLLSAKHRLAQLIFEAEHVRLLHGGPSLLLCSIRDNFWVTGGRNLARAVVHRCVKCFRVRPRPLEQIMGVLPRDRVHPTPPFYVSGTDYAGPFVIKNHKGRGSKTSKCYICLFICCSTKAVHLELVTDLTADAFIACLRRFISRRGRPLKLLSDNGLNYVGANSELKKLIQLLKVERDSINDMLGLEGIEWSFIPANSPNFGGLWEAGIKSCKLHLKRTLANASLTFEEFYTVITQIEAVLNSRPLCPMSPDPSDFDVLTPSHFLLGRKITSLPDKNWKEVPINRLSKWEHLQMLLQHFWNRWSSEYLSQLQTRSKWTRKMENVELNQLVVIKDDNVPPLRWKLGRVVAVHKGPDGNVRVVEVKTQHGPFKRAITKICPLPKSV